MLKRNIIFLFLAVLYALSILMLEGRGLKHLSVAKKVAGESLQEEVNYLPGFNEAAMLWLKAQQSGICHLHKLEMNKTIVPVVYGIVDFALPPPPSLKNEKFPHSDFVLIGGAFERYGAPTEEEIFVCESCLRKRELWEKIEIQKMKLRKERSLEKAEK